MKRELPRGFTLDLIALTFVLSAVAVVAGGVIHFYQQGAFMEALSAVSDERIPNTYITGLLGVPETSTLLGFHAFSDYLQPHYWVTLADPWLQDGTRMINYLPQVLLVHEALAFLPYRAGFLIYELAMVVALAAPAAYALRGTRWPVRLLGVLILGILTGPSIASLDRGNTQGFVPILLFAFAIAVLRARWGWATVFLIGAASIKIFPLVLVLVFIALRKWIPALVAVLGTALLSLVTLPLVSSNLWPTARLIFTNPLLFDDRTFVEFMSRNVAVAGGVAHLASSLGLDGVASWIASHGLVIGLLYLAAVAPLLWFARIPLWLRLIIAMGLTTGVMPLTYPYALNWVVAANAVVLFVATRAAAPDSAVSAGAGGRAEPVPVPVRTMVLIALALVSAVLPLYWPGSMERGLPVGLAAGAALVAALLLPAAGWSMALSRRRTPVASARP